MYPRNAASPERLSIGAVVAIADGTVQTSGCSIAVMPQGGASAAGLGTIAYDNGIVLYTPTQAETNYSSFVVTAYKTGCIPVSVTVITSKSDTAGYAGIDWGQVLNKTTTNALTGTTIATTQKVDIETIKTQAVTCAAGVTVLASVGTAATSTAQTGDAYARLGAPAGASIAADIASIKTDTGTTIPGRLPAALVGGRMDAYVGAMAANVLDSSALATSAVTEIQTGLSTLDAAGVRTALGLASANLDTQLGTLATSAALASVASMAYAIKLQTDNLPADPADQSAVEAAITASLTTSLAESYRTAGSTGSVAQLLYELVAHAGEAVISGTTKTINKLDHLTPAATFTLDDATNPSSITRAT